MGIAHHAAASAVARRERRATAERARRPRNRDMCSRLRRDARTRGCAARRCRPLPRISIHASECARRSDPWLGVAPQPRPATLVRRRRPDCSSNRRGPPLAARPRGRCPPKKRLISAARPKSARSLAVASVCQSWLDHSCEPLEHPFAQEEHVAGIRACAAAPRPARRARRPPNRARSSRLAAAARATGCRAGVSRARDVHAVEFGDRAQIEDPQRRIAAHDEAGEIGRGDVIPAGLDRGGERPGIDGLDR